MQVKHGFDKFTVLNSAWLEIAFPFAIKGWTWWVTGGAVLVRGMNQASRILLDAAAVVDAGGGKVQIAAADNHLTIGDVALFPAGVTTNYTGEHTLTAGTTDDILEFADTYVAETIGADKVVLGYRDVEYPEGFGDAEAHNWPENTPLFKMKGKTGTVYVHFRIVR